MRQVLNLMVSALDVVAICIFFKDKFVKKKNLILFVLIYLAAFWWIQSSSLSFQNREFIYILLMMFITRKILHKKTLNANVYGTSFLVIKHISLIVGYSLLFSINGGKENILSGELTTCGAVLVITGLIEIGIIYFAKKLLYNYLESEDEIAGQCFWFGCFGLWGVFLTLERLMLETEPFWDSDFMLYVGVLFLVILCAFLFGYRSHKKWEAMELKAKEHRKSILDRYGTKKKLEGKEASTQNKWNKALRLVLQERTQQSQEAGAQLLLDGDFSFLEKIDIEDAISLMDSLIEYTLKIYAESGRGEGKILITGYEPIARIECECPCSMEFLKNQKGFSRQNVALNIMTDIARKYDGWVKQRNKRGVLTITVKFRV